MGSKFAVSHRKSARFRKRGLRTYFRIPGLGIKRASGGKVVAHVIPRVPARRRTASGTARLQSAVRYVLRGSAGSEYEGVGRVTMKAGSCSTSPPASATAKSAIRATSR